MTYKLSKRSKANLTGVFPGLISVVHKAITLTEIDFGVSEGLRLLERQKQLVAEGKSWTLKSKHLKQPDGFAHAVDLIAYSSGRVSWEMRDYSIIAEAMQEASNGLDIILTWGAVWDRRLHELSLCGDSFNDDIDAYVKRFKKKYGRRPHLDGPHFQKV